MGLAKALVIVRLSILLLNSFTVLADFSAIDAQAPVPPRHHAYYAHPIASPAHPPTHGHHHHPKPHSPPPTASPPAHTPAHPPHHHHHHAHPPTQTPASSPYHHAPPSHSPSPVHPPTSHAPPPHHAPAPVNPPTYPPKKSFPRSFVAVQGVVYCKSCKYAGVDTLLNATAIAGATVQLQCNNTKYPFVVKGKTDKNGYFFITAPKTITTYGAHKCKASLVSAPTTACSKITDFHGGLLGAALKPTKPFMSEKKLPFLLYTVGPFAFESKCPR